MIDSAHVFPFEQATLGGKQVTYLIGIMHTAHTNIRIYAYMSASPTASACVEQCRYPPSSMIGNHKTNSLMTYYVKIKITKEPEVDM